MLMVEEKMKEEEAKKRETKKVGGQNSTPT